MESHKLLVKFYATCFKPSPQLVLSITDGNSLIEFLAPADLLELCGQFIKSEVKYLL
ncbi:hypothetical protein FIU95_09845 [Microbulbifer sp. THAF38]|nr:hypothetical protein FIU95_09845 [Microbulbifer sp. THAF38]